MSLRTLLFRSPYLFAVPSRRMTMLREAGGRGTCVAVGVREWVRDAWTGGVRVLLGCGGGEPRELDASEVVDGCLRRVRAAMLGSIAGGMASDERAVPVQSLSDSARDVDTGGIHARVKLGVERANSTVRLDNASDEPLLVLAAQRTPLITARAERDGAGTRRWAVKVEDRHWITSRHYPPTDRLGGLASRSSRVPTAVYMATLQAHLG